MIERKIKKDLSLDLKRYTLKQVDRYEKANIELY